LRGATPPPTVATAVRRDAITDLRRAIDSLPIRTREAMLEGIRSNPIVVGAYTDDRGGICPMLAAHRHGGRTTLLAFARSWDRFARARTVRRATRRELAVLEAQLSESLLMAGPEVDLKAAIADHEALKRRHDREFPEIRAARLKPRDARRALARLERELELV
jgi:hypothetical protein